MGKKNSQMIYMLFFMLRTPTRNALRSSFRAVTGALRLARPIKGSETCPVSKLPVQLSLPFTGCFPYQIFLLSMTRTALPSLLAMVRGATRVTFALIPSMDFMPSTSAFWRAEISPRLSVNISGVIST